MESMLRLFPSQGPAVLAPVRSLPLALRMHHTHLTATCSDLQALARVVDVLAKNLEKPRKQRESGQVIARYLTVLARLGATVIHACCWAHREYAHAWMCVCVCVCVCVCCFASHRNCCSVSCKRTAKAMPRRPRLWRTNCSSCGAQKAIPLAATVRSFASCPRASTLMCSHAHVRRAVGAQVLVSRHGQHGAQRLGFRTCRLGDGECHRLAVTLTLSFTHSSPWRDRSSPKCWMC